jgi:hypothetical protein
VTVCDACGAESLPARLPSGRHIELSTEWTWVGKDEPWPDARLFIAVSKPDPDGRHPEPYYAKPATALMDRGAGKSGPFHREHVCERVSA